MFTYTHSKASTDVEPISAMLLLLSGALETVAHILGDLTGNVLGELDWVESLRLNWLLLLGGDALAHTD